MGVVYECCCLRNVALDYKKVVEVLPAPKLRYLPRPQFAQLVVQPCYGLVRVDGSCKILKHLRHMSVAWCDGWRMECAVGGTDMKRAVPAMSMFELRGA